VSGHASAGVDMGEMVAAAERRQEDVERAARLLEEAEDEFGVLVQDIALDAIEPDPSQPRRVFDEEKLASLAASIKQYGLLQEPGVVAAAVDAAGVPTRFRLVWGERRWRACRIAGLTRLRCKVLPPGDDTAAEQLRTKEKQWAENAEREGLSPIEEAIAIQDAVEIERRTNPDVALGELVEKVGVQRGFAGQVARNLVGLLKAPQCLQNAVMRRAIGREVGFELARYWTKLLEEHELHGKSRREIQFANLVASWARSRGLALNLEAMSKYAAETFQDPKVVKATCRKAEELQSAVQERFKAVVDRAQKQKWTVARARAVLAGKGGESEEEGRPVLFEYGGKARARLTVHLDRLRNRALGTREERADLVAVLLGIIGEIHSLPEGADASKA